MQVSTPSSSRSLLTCSTDFWQHVSRMLSSFWFIHCVYLLLMSLGLIMYYQIMPSCSKLVWLSILKNISVLLMEARFCHTWFKILRNFLYNIDLTCHHNYFFGADVGWSTERTLSYEAVQFNVCLKRMSWITFSQTSPWEPEGWFVHSSYLQANAFKTSRGLFKCNKQ